VLKGWQSEYFSQLKRKADGEVDEHGDKENKKRIVASSHGIPVRPEDFWPASDEEQDKKENVEKVSAKSAENTTEREKIAGNNLKSNEVIDSDSDTEEEEDIISLAAPIIKKAAPSSSPNKALIKQASSEKDTATSTEASPPIKHTTVSAPIIVTKRDRFGRSDF